MDPPNLIEPDNRHRQRPPLKREAMVSHSRAGRLGFVDPTWVESTRTVHGRLQAHIGRPGRIAELAGRMHAQTAMIENGFVHIPETAPWLAEYLHEISVFPKGKHDDQVDSTAQFLDWFKKPFPGQGLLDASSAVDR